MLLRPDAQTTRATASGTARYCAAPRRFSLQGLQGPRLQRARQESRGGSTTAAAVVRTTSPAAETLSKLTCIQRQLEIAVAEENYGLAAQLRDQTKVMFDALPATQQYMYHQLRALHAAKSVEDKLKAVEGLGATGDEAALPHLAELLADDKLHSSAQSAMWAIFMHCKDPMAQEWLTEGTRLLPYEQFQEKVRQMLEKVIARCPDFAEGYNKRATLNYTQRRFEESIRDCKKTLAMQPYHFGAASGMGLCYLELADQQAALQAFEQALSINPGLTDIARIAVSLRQSLELKRNKK